MDIAHWDELVRCEEAYWWHVAKRQLILGILRRQSPAPARLVEGGIGAARNLLEFQAAGYEVTGFDVLDQAVQYARRRGLTRVQQHDLETPWPVEPSSMDVVVFLDVLEHLAKPVQVLRHARQALRPNGHVVLTVPAYPGLYGDWDRSLGHYRRYTTSRLREDAEQSGLAVRWISHWNAFSLPAAVLVRTYQRIAPADRAPRFPRVGAVTNRLLLNLAALERECLSRMRLPFGLSLVGVLRK